MQKFNFLYCLLFITALSSCGLFRKRISEKPVLSHLTAPKEKLPDFCYTDSLWADSVLHSLSGDERIGQLFMVAAYSNKDSSHQRQIDTLIIKHHIGGLIFMQGGPVRQSRLINHYQSISKTPLLIAMDGEWGPAMRLDSIIKFPYQMTLGAVQNQELIYRMGAEIASQCRRLGVHVNFAPVADINCNPLNPVINYRSFGENKQRVAAAAMSYMKGMQDNGILATAKHFPGHGDTETDSHLALPVISHSRKRLDTLELYPFKEMIGEGLSGIMVAHLHIPAYDTTTNLAVTLSPYVVNDLLRNTLEFKGLVITDALNMQGVSKFYKPGIVDVKALLAGNDILLFPEDVEKAVLEIRKAIASGLISMKEIDKRCRKILLAKRFAGLDRPVKIDEKKIINELNTATSEYIVRQLYEEALTVLVNKNNIIPLQNPDTLKILSCSMGKVNKTAFQSMVDRYSYANHLNFSNQPEEEQWNAFRKKANDHNIIVLGLHLSGQKPDNNYGLTDKVTRFLQRMHNGEDSLFFSAKKIILVVFGNPYALSLVPECRMFDALIVAYEDNKFTKELAAQLVFGGISAKGKLPVTAGAFPVGSGLATQPPVRLKYTMPEELRIRSEDLSMVDSIAVKAIRSRATPGCQILAAKDGKVFYYKSFGYHTYDSAIAVKETDLYDIASITKITATLPAVMKLVDDGKLSIDGLLGKYLPALQNTNKDTLSIRKVLAHHAQLRSWIPFWMRTVKKGRLSDKLYNEKPTKKFTIRVADSLYLHKIYRDSIFQIIAGSPLRNKKEYYYSDLGFYLLKDIVEKVSGEPLENFARKQFYIPMGMTTMGYKPYGRFSMQRIVPTENDTAFRKQLLHGDVHDPGAAMLGGVGGHAGIFASANDVAKMMQMYLNKGEYGGVRYIKASTVNEFIRCQYCNEGNRRGLGFDKPEPDTSKPGPVCRSASLNSFGHTGYTGTMAWADPGENFIYVFLSNRVHPSAANNKLVEMNVRTDIQQVFYDAIQKSKAQQQ